MLSCVQQKQRPTTTADPKMASIIIDRCSPTRLCTPSTRRHARRRSATASSSTIAMMMMMISLRCRRWPTLRCRLSAARKIRLRRPLPPLPLCGATAQPSSPTCTAARHRLRLTTRARPSAFDTPIIAAPPRYPINNKFRQIFIK